MQSLITDKTQNIYGIFAVLLIILSPFGNLELQASPLGYLGAMGPTIVVLPYMVYCIFKAVVKRKVKTSILYPTLYIIFISLIYVPVVNPIMNGENVYEKAWKIFLVYEIIILIINFPKVENEIVCKSCIVGLIIALLSLYLFRDNSFLNYAGTNEDRPRGYMMEASHLAQMTGYLALLGYATAKKKITQLLLVCLGLYITIYSQSKGGEIVYILAFLGMYMHKKNNRFFKILLLASATLAIYTIVIPQLGNQFQGDIDNYTSTATRSTGIISSFLLLLHYPLGGGVFAYYQHLFSEIPKTVNLLSDVFPYLNFSEVLGYRIQSGLVSVGTKSFLADIIIIAGIPAIIYFFRIAIGIWNKVKIEKNISYIPVFYFIFLSLIFWTDGRSFYIIFFVVSQLRNLQPKEKAEGSKMSTASNHQLRFKWVLH